MAVARVAFYSAKLIKMLFLGAGKMLTGLKGMDRRKLRTGAKSSWSNARAGWSEGMK